MKKKKKIYLQIGGASGKEQACQGRLDIRHTGLSQCGRSPGEGNGNPLQYS